MTKCLIDTNVLIAIDNPNSASREIAIGAVHKLRAEDVMICVCPQVCSEYWSIMTRPSPRGMSFTASEAAISIQDLRYRLYQWITEPNDLFDEWSRLCVAFDIRGAKCYDARLVSLMTLQGVDRILTFNTKDFSAFTQITAVDPINL